MWQWLVFAFSLPRNHLGSYCHHCDSGLLNRHPCSSYWFFQYRGIAGNYTEQVRGNTMQFWSRAESIAAPCLCCAIKAVFRVQKKEGSMFLSCLYSPFLPYFKDVFLQQNHAGSIHKQGRLGLLLFAAPKFIWVHCLIYQQHSISM